MKNLKKYIALNLLSMCGYIFVVLLLVIVFYIYPLLKHADTATIDDAMFTAAGFVFFCLISTAILAVVEVFLCLIIFPIEFVVYKLGKFHPPLTGIPANFYKLHLYLFSAGVIISVIPVLLMCVYFCLPV